jgi:hypothetical protein
MTSNNLNALISAFQMNKFYNIFEIWAAVSILASIFQNPHLVGILVLFPCYNW